MSSFRGPDGQEDMPYLLTPCSVTTSRGVKFAMLADWGPRDPEFLSLVKTTLLSLKKLAECDDGFECVIVQGASGSGVEAALGSFTPTKRKKTLMVSNGASGQRAIQTMQRIGRNHVVLNCNAYQPIAPAIIAKALNEDRNITHVWVVQCETSTGVVNPIADIAREVKSCGRIMMVDAVAGFGALPVQMGFIDVLVSSPNRCLESIGGFAFVIARHELLLAAKGECHSLVLDLYEQWSHFENTGHMRNTAPTHALVALHQALRELSQEGGVEGRSQRYRKTADALITRIKALGFSSLLPAHESSPIVQTILAPRDAKYTYAKFAEKLRLHGFVVHPGVLGGRESFRIGTIGKVDDKLIAQLITAIEAVMSEMGVRNFAPAGE
jgi:2-aminoethylphosphonate-pyruvate transaminase